MKNTFCATVFFMVLLFVSFSGVAQQIDKLPEGDTGIASKYPGDKGIANDPAVLFADDFENSSTINDLTKRWDILSNDEHLSIDTKEGFEGNSLLMTILEAGNSTGN